MLPEPGYGVFFNERDVTQGLKKFNLKRTAGWALLKQVESLDLGLVVNLGQSRGGRETLIL
jgi:hypothetical protein